MALNFRPAMYINLPMLLRVIGWLLLIESGFMLIPLATSIIFGESEWTGILLAIGITMGAGLLMTSLRPRSREMGKREAILLTALTWVILSLFGMLPFYFCSTHKSITDAFFETISGFTTTGATVLDTMHAVPHSILIWRSVTQWIGGMGIILFTLAVVPMLNYTGGIKLFNAEVTGITHDKLRPRVSYTAKSLWGIYFCLTVLLILLLWLGGMDIFQSICHGFSIISTGGFSTNDTSIGAWSSSYIKLIITIFMFIGGINFSLIFKSITGQFRSVLHNDVLKWYIILIFVAYLIFATNMFFNPVEVTMENLTIDPLFQAVSIITSTAFMEPDFSQWGSLAVITLIILMFIGGCAGSTSGGAKIDRILVLFKFLNNEFYRMMHPDAVRTVRINGQGTSYVLVQKVLGFLFVYIMVIIVGGLLLVLLGLPPLDGFFAALQAISNTGLGTPNTGMAGDYGHVCDAAKWILGGIMLIGRLEIYTVLLLFTPVFWKK